jgi:hypothetical protein
MGAVIFVDFWLAKRLGFRPDYAAASGIGFNWAAGVAWLLTIGCCVLLIDILGRPAMWFVSLPGWFIAAALYIVLSRVYQRRAAHPAPVGVA